MKTANDLRVDLANSQRMKKTRDKWLGLADKLHDIDQWQEKTEHNGTKIGDRVGFVQSRRVGNGYSFSQKYGIAFAFGDDAMVVVFNGELKRVNLD